MFTRFKKSNTTPYFARNTWRELFLIYDNPIHKSKERVVFDRSSTLPYVYNGLQVKIYRGNKFHNRTLNRWMVGYKFGEFTWTRKVALYKAKQLRKKKKK